jgi:hypothetical protein
MTLTKEILTTLEREAIAAPAAMLERCAEFVLSGIKDAPPEVRAHGHVLILKLEHLIRCERVAAALPAADGDSLAPWLAMTAPLRTAA